MNEEKDFFKTCFNTVAGLEVKNESQAIAKEVVLSEIEQLQRENKILRENAEHNDKVVDKVNWDNMLLKKENKQLKERIEYLERSNNRREDTILEQRQEISDLGDNWNKLKKLFYQKYYNGERIDTKDILDKMQELEQGDLIEK